MYDLLLMIELLPMLPPVEESIYPGPELVVKDTPIPEPEIGCVEGIYYFINCPNYFFANN